MSNPPTKRSTPRPPARSSKKPVSPVANGQFAGADVHGIPGKGHEPYHLHHDLLLRFQAQTEALTCSDESHSVAWCTRAELDRYAVPDNVRRAWDRYK